MTVVEFFVSTPRMDVVRCHRFERVDEHELLTIRREWAWNYSTGEYNHQSDSHSVGVTPDGTVKHAEKSIAEYARDRTDTLTAKRFGHHPERGGVVIERTR